MASTAEGRRLTTAHRQAQVRLGAQTATNLLRVWPLLDLTAIDATLQRWLTAALAVVQAQHAASTQLAAAYYRSLRRTEAPVSPPVTPPAPRGLDAAAAATSLIVTGPARVKAATGRGVSLAQASRIGQTASARAGHRLALDGGRRHIIDTTQVDPDAAGVVRVTGGKPCAYCDSLAGLVFRDEAAASFKVHDGCSCGPEPVIGAAGERAAQEATDARAEQAIADAAESPTEPPSVDRASQRRPPEFSDLTRSQMDEYRASVAQVAAGERTSAEHWAWVHDLAQSIRT